MKYKIAAIAMAGLLTAAMLSSCGNETQPQATSKGQSKSQVTETTPVKKNKGKPFDQFTARDLDGNTVTQDILKEYDLTVMNIWGTFCGPCINEMPNLGKLAKEYQEQGVQFVGVVIDAAGSDGQPDERMVEEAKRIVSETGADYLHLLPSDDLNRIKLSQVTGVPETVFLDSGGNVVDSVVGAMDEEQWVRTISMMLEEVNK